MPIQSPHSRVGVVHHLGGIAGVDRRILNFARDAGFSEIRLHSHQLRGSCLIQDWEAVVAGASNNTVTGNLISVNAAIGVLVAAPGTFWQFHPQQPDRPGLRGRHFPDQPRRRDLARQRLPSDADRRPRQWVRPTPSVETAGGGIVLFDTPTAGQTIQRNSIIANGGQGIALFNGSNHAQVAPVIASAVLTTATTVTGSLSSTANTSFTVEFFSSPGPNEL